MNRAAPFIGVSAPPKNDSGGGDENSDLDLLVIEREVPDKAAEYLKFHRAVGSIGVGVDVLVCSEEEFERRSQVPGTVPYWARKEGKVVYDSAHPSGV